MAAVHDHDVAHDAHDHHPSGADALDWRHQPQGHRHDVPVVQLHHVPDRRRDGADHPRRAVPAGPADRSTRVLQPADHHARADHGVRRDHAGLRRLRELADPAADRRAGHGVRAHEQLELLAAAAGGAAADGLVLRAGRRACGRLDDVSAAVGADGHGHGHGDLRDPHHGRLVDHGLDQHHHHHPQHARAGHDADEDAAVRLDLADHRLPADRW